MIHSPSDWDEEHTAVCEALENHVLEGLADVSSLHDKMDDTVGGHVGEPVGAWVGTAEGDEVGTNVVGEKDGNLVGDNVVGVGEGDVVG